MSFTSAGKGTQDPVREGRGLQALSAPPGLLPFAYPFFAARKRHMLVEREQSPLGLLWIDSHMSAVHRGLLCRLAARSQELSSGQAAFGELQLSCW